MRHRIQDSLYFNRLFNLSKPTCSALVYIYALINSNLIRPNARINDCICEEDYSSLD